MASSYKVRMHPDAVDDLDQVYQWIAKDNPSRAKKFVQGLQKKIFDLKYYPHRGSRCRFVETSHVFQELRFISYQRHLIFYEVISSEVLVLHVTGPGRDWISLFL